MKKITFAITCFAIILTFGSCPNPFTAKPQPNAAGLSLPDGYGAVQVSLVTGSARTALPVLDDLGVDIFLKFSFEKLGEDGYEEPDVKDEISFTGNNTQTFMLAAGDYKLEVEAYYLEGEEKMPVARGMVDENDGIFTVGSGEIDSCFVRLYPIVEGEETGTLKFTINYIGDDDVSMLAFTLIKLFPYEPENNVIEDIEKMLTGIPCSYFTGGSLIPAGFYLLNVKLMNTTDCSFASKSEVVHIYGNMLTVKEFKFDDNNFISNIVFDNGDYVNKPGDLGIPGTLRFAIENAQSGAVISVMLPPGSVIKLESTLSINTDLTIEGNGVTLTPADSKQIRLMSLASLCTYKISRVHFKGGEIAGKGGAINADTSTLTLESCIFSGNEAIYDSVASEPDYGGAVYTLGHLIVKGCTFYGNSANQGGAIYSMNQAVTLTGNLFYGNTASGASGGAKVPSAVADGGSLSHTSNYNVSDAMYNGFAPGFGEAFLNAPVVAPLSLKLLDYDENYAVGVITEALDSDYPKKDFYGNAITGAAVSAGAVQATTASGVYVVVMGEDVTIVDDPNEDGLYSDSVTFKFGEDLAEGQMVCWLVNEEIRESNGSEENQLTLNMSNYSTYGYVEVAAYAVDADIVTTWSALENAIADANNGLSGEGIYRTFILINSNFVFTDTITIDDNKKITLVSRSKVAISRDTSFQDNFFEVKDGGSLCIGFLSSDIILDGKGSGNEPFVVVNDGGELLMEEGVTLQNNGNGDNPIQLGGAVLVNSGGEFIMVGGEITNNWADCGGGVYVNGGTFNMHYGEIYDNEADYGGGVYVTAEGTFKSGSYGGGFDGIPATGKVSRNKAKNGGGVYVNSGWFYMDGGEILNNKAENSGGGVYVGSDGEFVMCYDTGIDDNIIKITRKISGNTAQRGGGVYVGGTFTMHRGIISGNTAKAGSLGDAGRGGGVFVAGSAVSFTKYNNAEYNEGESGIIYGENEEDLSNSAFSNYGHAVYVSGTAPTIFDAQDIKGRNDTVEEHDELDSAVSSGGGWDWFFADE